MSIAFDRDGMARWYAKQHLKTDPGIQSIYYLPQNASEREIRLLEINTLIIERTFDELEPVDFGVDTGMDSEHQLVVLDVTPAEWEKIRTQDLSLPGNWSLDQAISLKGCSK